MSTILTKTPVWLFICVILCFVLFKNSLKIVSISFSVPISSTALSLERFDVRAFLQPKAIKSNKTDDKKLSEHKIEKWLAANRSISEARMLNDLVQNLKKASKMEPHDPSNDPNVVHPHPFKYVINSPEVCGNSPVFIFIYVHTAPNHYKRRDVIRKTYADIRYFEKMGVSIRVAFFMGTANEADPAKQKSLQDSLLFEQSIYSDLVQEDFLDTYHNLTYKGVAALKWIAYNCRQAVYILKTDDDIFVNMFTLVKRLQRMAEHSENLSGMLLCLVWYNMPVMRSGKWKVTKEEYKDDSYPTYCSGSAFVLTTDVAIQLYQVSYFVPFFWVDDFYITGLLALKAGNVTHRQFSSTYVLNGEKLEEIFTGPMWSYHVFSHIHDLNRILSVWKKLKKLATGETKPVIKTALPGQI